ncbi:hypothetical protein BKE12_09760 [Listeria monocytogenes]|nr:hypothetical protein [Listeria monocytogenes]EGN7538658.1 hypothetical protein [Listeria monocytogenes]EIR0577760.1 hypothetical protein [Listeria monocytogenes]
MNIFFDANGVFQWSSVTAVVAIIGAAISGLTLWLSIKNQKNIRKSQLNESIELDRLKEIKKKVVRYLHLFNKIVVLSPQYRKAKIETGEKFAIQNELNESGKEFELLYYDLLMIFNSNIDIENEIIGSVSQLCRMQAYLYEYFLYNLDYKEVDAEQLYEVKNELLDMASAFMQSKYKELRESY